MDMRRLVESLREPLRAYSSPSGARVCPGATRATAYGERAAGMEGFGRPLWPVVADTARSEPPGVVRPELAAVNAGVDPRHPDYWGELGDTDQRSVEMAVLGWALAAAPAAWWDPLADDERERLARWLGRINDVFLPANNWRFFRLLVNAGLRRVGAPWSPARWADDLALIEDCYLDGGWYSDGVTPQRDYYVAMAMHFYGLLIAGLDLPELGERNRRYRERARLFARDFILWFASDGSALPYGRSLTYRFAQGAFWAALAWCGEEALPWGVIKGLLLRHLRWWLGQPIFTESGVLTIGYSYPNLFMSESYNAPASPYWAMKALLPAALPETHPFWQAEELPLPELPTLRAQPHAGLLIRRHDGGDITALASGQFTNGWHLRHEAEKYAKFAYSTRFGFSVPAGQTTLKDGAHDNALALSEEGQYWRVRHACREARVADDTLISEWYAWPDVRVRTWLFFDGAWQVRVHRLETARVLLSAEAGHALPRHEVEAAEEHKGWHTGPGFAAAVGADAMCGLFDGAGTRRGEVILTAANTNLLHPRTVLPTLHGEHAPGVHWLVTLLPVSHRLDQPDSRVRPVVEIVPDADGLRVRLPGGGERRFADA